MSRAILGKKEVAWAYDKWCIGYTHMQIADALNVCEKTVSRALKGKPRIRPTLKYEYEGADLCRT